MYMYFKNTVYKSLLPPIGNFMLQASLPCSLVWELWILHWLCYRFLYLSGRSLVPNQYPCIINGFGDCERILPLTGFNHMTYGSRFLRCTHGALSLRWTISTKAVSMFREYFKSEIEDRMIHEQYSGNDEVSGS